LWPSTNPASTKHSRLHARRRTKVQKPSRGEFDGAPDQDKIKDQRRQILSDRARRLQTSKPPSPAGTGLSATPSYGIVLHGMQVCLPLVTLINLVTLVLEVECETTLSIDTAGTSLVAEMSTSSARISRRGSAKRRSARGEVSIGDRESDRDAAVGPARGARTAWCRPRSQHRGRPHPAEASFGTGSVYHRVPPAESRVLRTFDTFASNVRQQLTQATQNLLARDCPHNNGVSGPDR
jgi:hypothetical protein